MSRKEALISPSVMYDPTCPYSYIDRQVTVRIERKTDFKFRVMFWLVTAMTKLLAKDWHRAAPDEVCVSLSYGAVKRQ